MSVNVTNACAPDVPASIYLFTFTSLINILIVCKSLFVIILTCCNVGLSRNINIVFASMSVNDLLLGVALSLYQVTILPFDVGHMLKSNFIICISFGICNSAVIVSLMHMAVLALDRYIHILHPIYYMRYATKRCILIALLCVWATGSIIKAIPMLVYTDAKYHKTCLFFNPPIVYFSVITFIYCVIFLAVCTCYFKISYLAFTRKKAANGRRLTVHDNSVLRNNRPFAARSVKFFIIMFGMFALFTFPNVFKTWLNYMYSMGNSIHRILLLCIPAYSIFNIVNYGMINREFSQLIQSTFSFVRRVCCRRKQQW